MSSKKSLTYLAACSVLFGSFTGCATGAGSKGIPVPGFMSGWFGKKSDMPRAPDGDVSQAMKPWTDRKEPSAIQKIGTSISESSMAKTVSGTFSKASHKMSDAVGPKNLDPPDALSLDRPAKPSADIYVSVARIQEKHGNTEEAIEKYKRALELDPDHLGALVGLGRAYDRQNKLEDATKCYVHAMRKHPQEAGTMNDLALCYARQGKYDDSMQTLRHAIEVQPDKVLYRNNLATVLIEVDRVEEAVAQLEAVHGKPVACYNVGVLLARRGRMSAAVEQFKVASAADPSFEEARQWLVALNGEAPTQVASAPKPVVPGLTPSNDLVEAMPSVVDAVTASAESSVDADSTEPSVVEVPEATTEQVVADPFSGSQPSDVPSEAPTSVPAAAEPPMPRYAYPPTPLMNDGNGTILR